jgi:transcriptional regulator with XRE-family HTH domain
MEKQICPDLPEIHEHPLKGILRQRGIRQVQVAHAVGVSVASLNAILNGYRRPSREVEAQLESIKRKIEQNGNAGA